MNNYSTVNILTLIESPTHEKYFKTNFALTNVDSLRDFWDGKWTLLKKKCVLMSLK